MRVLVTGGTAWEKIMEFDQCLDTQSIEVYGATNDAVSGMMTQMADQVSWIRDGSSRQDQSRGRVHPARLICGRDGLMGPSSRPGGRNPVDSPHARLRDRSPRFVA